MNNVMIDLETMGTGPNAAIVAIGACQFDTTGVGAQFYEVVDLKSSVQFGMEIDPDTVMWWLQQSDSARRALCSGVPIHLNSALTSLAEWLPTNPVIWGNGAAFDNVILSHAYKINGLKTPWEFWNDRCYRTMKNMYPNISMQRTGEHHCAIDDAVSQAQHLIDILKHINTTEQQLTAARADADSWHGIALDSMEMDTEKKVKA